MMVLACAFSLLYSAPVVVDEPPGKPVAALTAPFEMLPTRHMAIRIMVNGKGPFRVIFDTGAPVSLVSSKLAEETGVLKDSKQGTGAMPMMFGMRGQATIKSFGLGELTAENVQVIVMDHPAVTAISKVLGRVDGIIGFPFFARYRLTLDYQKQQLTFQPSDYEPGDVMAGLMKMMMSSRSKSTPILISAPGIWGFTVGKSADDEEEGIEITQVFAGSPADKAAIKVGDRLLVFDGTWTETVEDCHRAASKVKVGQTVLLQIRREGKKQLVKVTPRHGL